MMETETQAPPAAAPASLWEDFIDIFYAPSEVYDRRRDAGFGVPLLIVTLIIAALFFASQGPLGDAMAAEFRRAMEQNGQTQMTPEQQAGAMRMGKIIGMVGMLIGFPLSVVLVGLVLWAIGKAFGFVGTAGMAILVVTYAQIPRILQTLSGLLQGLLMDPRSLAATSLGPARFLDPEATSGALLAFVMRIDPFYVWSTILIAIGAHVIGRVPKAQAYLLAGLIWLVGAIPTVLPALLRR